MKILSVKRLVEKHPPLGSSQDPEKLAMRVKADLIALIPIVVLVLRLLGVEGIDETGLIGLVDLISQAVMYGGFLLAVGMKIYGYLRALKS